MTDASRKEQLEALQREIQDRALRLTDLEVIIQDYNRERQRLLEEIIVLKEQLWELMADQTDE
jgi:predicted  nucleic acid-binding Zn-ribbon protein